MNAIFKSWQTSLAGAGTFLTLLGTQLNAQFDNDPTTLPDWGLVVAGAFILIALLRSRDSDVSSESAGAK